MEVNRVTVASHPVTCGVFAASIPSTGAWDPVVGPSTTVDGLHTMVNKGTWTRHGDIIDYTLELEFDVRGAGPATERLYVLFPTLFWAGAGTISRGEAMIYNGIYNINNGAEIYSPFYHQVVCFASSVSFSGPSKGTTMEFACLAADQHPIQVDFFNGNGYAGRPLVINPTVGADDYIVLMMRGTMQVVPTFSF